MSNEPSDEALALLWQLGDMAAVAILVNRHHPAMLNYAFERLPDQASRREKAEELVQETWLKVHKTIYQFNPLKSSFGFWLIKLNLVCIIFSYLRLKGRRHEVCDQDVSPQQVDRDSGTSIVEARSLARDPSVDYDEVQLLVDEFRKSLNSRECLVLDAILDPDPPGNAELAADLEVMPTTLANIKSVVRGKLRDYLGGSSDGAIVVLPN